MKAKLVKENIQDKNISFVNIFIKNALKDIKDYIKDKQKNLKGIKHLSGRSKEELDKFYLDYENEVFEFFSDNIFTLQDMDLDDIDILEEKYPETMNFNTFDIHAWEESDIIIEDYEMKKIFFEAEKELIEKLKFKSIKKDILFYDDKNKIGFYQIEGGRGGPGYKIWFFEK